MHNLLFIEGRKLVIFLIQSSHMVQETGSSWVERLSYEKNALIHKFGGICC